LARTLFLSTILLCAVSALAAEQKLPLVEVPSTRGASDTLVVFVSGDGGWAAIDKSISKVLADNGLPVVGLNALQYFWTKRTPDTAARDLEIPRALMRRLGHAECGIYAEVIEAGTIGVGDMIAVEEPRQV